MSRHSFPLKQLQQKTQSTIIKERAREIEREGERGREEGGGGGRRGEGKGETMREWVGQGWTMVTLRTAWALWAKMT